MSAQKVVVVAYERWPVRRGSNNFFYRALTGKNLVFWIVGRLREVVAHGGLLNKTTRNNTINHY